MIYPENFISTTDFATLKNDEVGTITLALPNTASIAASGVATYSSVLTIGVVGSSVRSRITSTSNTKVFCTGTVGYSSTTGATVGGVGGFGYDLYVAVHRISPTQIQLSAHIPNPYGSTMDITGLSQTLTATIATFIPPFA